MASSPLPRWFSTILWGNTVALSWLWGLGLFFSVQFTTQFGLSGLLTFSIPNFIGLLVFGLVTHRIARRQEGSESLAQFFATWAKPFRLVLFLYQFLTVTLTVFTLVRYLWQPLGLQPWLLYLPLVVVVVLAVAILFGEEFNIKRIPFSHGAMFLLLAGAIGTLLGHAFQAGPGPSPVALLPTAGLNYWGYTIPILIGFLVGPWLDLQQWQRAIQMHRERVSIAASYWIGSLLFLGLLLFHGLLTLWALHWGAGQYIRTGIGGYAFGEEVLTRFFSHASTGTFTAYCLFISLAILTTLDSGYIALRWFLQSNVQGSKNILFSLLPPKLLTSPIPLFLLVGLFALLSVFAQFELEHFMVFYATFFVGYAVLSITYCFRNGPARAVPQIKMFCIGSVALVVFSFGYFLHHPAAQIVGSLLPLVYVVWLLLKPTSQEDLVTGADALEAAPDESQPNRGAVLQAGHAEAAPHAEAGAPAVRGGHHVSGHFEGNWFLHSFVATYADTNSVGNVYFGMYAMWVGKTRELFFNKVMPNFSLKSTPFFILTRSFEHKFVRETSEFETITVRLRIGEYNRKFVTLEHEIHDSANKQLGRGKQSLLFVSSTDYKMLDIPPEVMAAFTVYTAQG